MPPACLQLVVYNWLCVKNSNHHTELGLGYLKDTKFYLEVKVSFIRISSIVSLKPFLTVWFIWEYRTFFDSSVVSMKSSPWPKHAQY